MQNIPTDVSSGSTDSFIACQTSHGELRGTLIKLSRFGVMFEVYNPSSVLQLSQVLDDFRIIVHERTIYSGQATVRNLMNTGQVVICEVTLTEGSWRDLQFNPAVVQNGALKDRFGEFLHEWQKVYKVLPEYKMIIADIQV